ncbi:hypothetical protein CHS0354_017069 [Potamilus streckersoni]|uniref:Uncharacterized protein n=1 Tax=Potamilus streckersoni TaxID=2493646 RepID=A0AAE0VRG6_9BIVA|nr:hypothetical protein CHS0354_017069 [Potamilus streckersoni]
MLNFVVDKAKTLLLFGRKNNFMGVVLDGTNTEFHVTQGNVRSVTDTNSDLGCGRAQLRHAAKHKSREIFLIMLHCELYKSRSGTVTVLSGLNLDHEIIRLEPKDGANKMVFCFEVVYGLKPLTVVAYQTEEIIFVIPELHGVVAPFSDKSRQHFETRETVFGEIMGKDDSKAVKI